MTRFLGTIKLWADGDVRWDESVALSPSMSLDELETVYRAVVGAQAGARSYDDEGVIHLAASLLAKAGAAKARRIREEAAEAAS